MAGNWSYRNYRGRSSKKKVILAAVLVLVILASACVIALQKYVVYGADGRPYLDIPWGEEAPPQEDAVPPVEVTIQAPEGPPEIRAFEVAAGALTGERWQSAWLGASQMSAPAYNAAVFTVKDGSGSVYFDAPAAAGAVKTAEDTASALNEMTQGSWYAVARMACFRDPLAASGSVEAMGLKNTGGYIFYDGGNDRWLDPGKEEARAYLCRIARAAAEQGFDELVLTDVSYPTEGKLNKIDYGQGEREEHLRLFLEEVRTALEPYGTVVSVEAPAEAILAGGDENAGWSLEMLASLADRIYARTTPEQAASLARAVAAASGTTEFVPVVTEYARELSGSCVVSGPEE